MILAFMCRLFSVVRYESVIHEFDPWFNFRATRYLVSEGYDNFHNWFDPMTWYPLGRYIGGTLYPGLMATAAAGYHLLHLLHLPVDIRNVCVLLAPFMASLTALATYLLTREVWSASAGLFAAAFVAIVPGYISRSVAGSYDNEAVAIFALVFAFYLWIKAVKTGSMAWAAASALGYFYMVASWGGYIFITNLIPLHVLVLCVSGRYSHRLYVAYNVWYVLGMLMSMNIQFVGFQPVTSPEHLASIAIFVLLNVAVIYHWLKSIMPPQHIKLFFRSLGILTLGIIGVVLALAIGGQLPFLTGRLYTLLGATSNLAIIKSVSEHQPSPWTTFFFDLHCLVFLAPLGIYFCFTRLSDVNLFCILYVLFASYFSSIMVRLVLVLTPGMCVMAGIGASETFLNYFSILSSPSRSFAIMVARAKNSRLLNDPDVDDDTVPLTNKAATLGLGQGYGPRVVRVPRVSRLVAGIVLFAMYVLFVFYVIHCNWATSTAYSSPSIILMAQGQDGDRVIFDDFREAYNWLHHNTSPDAKILSWWDYGYQITGMGNRTTIVDNNTRNNSHIATVGLVMASSEERAYPLLKMLDVDYLLVVFGGRIGYSSDDINKFLWMVRISGGIFPEVVESDYFNAHGSYRVDDTAPPRMLNSLMYKMCYYRFGDSATVFGRPAGYDRVRNCEIGDKKVTLTHIEEAFTSEHWLVRIYRVKDDVSHPNFLDKLAAQKLA